jgi:adenosylhomocysteine nucleosidase
MRCGSNFVIAILVVITMAVSTRASDIAVLAAVDSELETLKKQGDLVGQSLAFAGRPVYQARFDGQPALLTKTGSSPEAVAPMIHWLVEDRHVGAVVSIGPAGALTDDMAIGEVVTVQKAVRDGNASSNSPWVLTSLMQCPVKPVGTVVTVGMFVAESGERARLRTTYHADLVDMSAAVIAEECVSHHVPCVLIRQITDRADRDAPRDFSEAVGSKHPLTIPGALCALQQLAAILKIKASS